MWALKILSGPQAGQVIRLKNGKNKFGRSPNCDFQIEGQGISKEHFEITVMSGKMMLTDLKSSNGTFVNGLRVQNSLVRAGDRLMAHQMLFEFIFASEHAPAKKLLPGSPPPTHSPVPMQPHVAIHSPIPMHHHEQQGPAPVQASLEEAPGL